MNKTLILLIFLALLYACASCGTPHAPEKVSGADLFKKHCVLCHGATGTLGLNGARDLSKSKLSREQRIEIVSNGKAAMPVFRQILSQDEIEAVAEYTFTLLTASNE
jgi:cytochrome c6